MLLSTNFIEILKLEPFKWHTMPLIIYIHFMDVYVDFEWIKIFNYSISNSMKCHRMDQSSEI